jgi:predicted membrane-bound dolichyl-phosphate-mannose-protein mannosyltransferase
MSPAELSPGYSRVLLTALLAVSFGLRALWLDYPGRVAILDEAYYLSSAHNILGLEQLPGNPYPYARPGLDPLIEHPIAGKLLIALSIRVLGDTPYAWRLPSAVAGTVVIWLVYLLAQRLTRRRGVSLAAATLTGLDPMMLVNSRIAMLEIFVTALILATLYFYVRRLPALAAVAAALAVCVKLTGVSAILCVVAFETMRTLRHRILTRRWNATRLRSLGVAIGVCAASVPLLLWLFNSRASLFPNPFDNLHYMYTHLAATFSFRPPEAVVVPQSRPWEWLVNVREIPYLSQGVMQLRGLYNPFLVFAFVPVVAWAVWLAARRGAASALMVVAMVAGCYLPLVAGSLLVPRPAYLYYFLPMIPALALGLATIGGSLRLPRAIKAGYLVAAACAFIYYFPFRGWP